MKVLVTGATGFIGYEVLLHLADAGHEIVILTREPATAPVKVPVLCKAYLWDPSLLQPPLEAFEGVDAVTEKAIVELLKNLRDQKKTLLIVHHDLSTAKEYFDQLLLLNLRMVAYGQASDVFTNELLQRTYGGKLTVLSEVGSRNIGKN